MQPFKIATWSEVPDREPVGALVSNVDLVIVRFDDNHSVLYGRCLHRGALMSDGRIEGDNIVCGLHGWDYVFQTGVSSYDNSERLTRFATAGLQAPLPQTEVPEMAGKRKREALG